MNKNVDNWHDCSVSCSQVNLTVTFIKKMKSNCWFTLPMGIGSSLLH